MENIVDYLVIIFFIVSGLASLFKKKADNKQKSQQAGTRPQPMQQKSDRIRPQMKQQPPKGPGDPFEEIADLIRRGTEKNTSEVDQYFEEALKKSKESEKPIKPTDYSTAGDKYRAIKSTEFREPTLMVTEMKKVTYKVNKRAEEIRKKLRNPSTIRDLIVINEILNKPKALRHKNNVFMLD